MNALEIWTRLAIWILLGGSIVVFVWFVRDVFRLSSSRHPRSGTPEAGEPPAAPTTTRRQGTPSPGPPTPGREEAR